MNTNIDKGVPIDHIFSKEYLDTLLNSIVNKTLGEVDKKNVFARAITNPKITGIAGDVIEQSVLGYSADSAQRPDLLVDDELVELKTTGIRENKNSGDIEAKEPASITAVSIGTIEREDFFDSTFWHKAQHILFVFYHYDSQTTVKALGYKDFAIRGHLFFKLQEQEYFHVVRNDWQMIHDYLAKIEMKYQPKDRAQHYPLLSTDLNRELVYLDTAPKYPHPPRIRFRKRLMTIIVQQKFGQRLAPLPGRYWSYEDVYNKCHEITHQYGGLTVAQLLQYFSIDTEGKTPAQIKSYAEKVVVNMFGGEAKKISDIKIFNDFGLIGKMVALTPKGSSTESMKLCSVDFTEFGEDRRFISDTDDGSSVLYDYIHDHKLLCIVFEEEPTKGLEQADLRNNVFKGFKIVDLDEGSIVDEAERTWYDTKKILQNDGLQSNPVNYKKTGKPRINKNGVVMEATNLPKQKDHVFFIRGTGEDSSKKMLIDNVLIYHQYYWIKGSYIASLLSKKEYL